MTTSILMSVYNGRDYLLEQLKSILQQSKLPDEVIIIDDCSTDDSAKLIKDFIDNNHLNQGWKLYKNTHNKGWKKNFIDGIDLTSGEIVFFSDQDDIWINKKIEIYCDVLMDDSIDVLISPYIEWHGESITVNEMHSEHHKIQLNGFFDNFNITGSGCTLAFKKGFYNRIRKYYVDGWAHDDFFRKMAQIDGKLAVLDCCSILRRFHGNNVTMQKRTYSSFCEELEVGIKSLDMMSNYIDDLGNKEIEKQNHVFLIETKRGYQNRLSYFYTGNPLFLLKTIVLNREQYIRKRQIIGDVLLVLKNVKNKDYSK